MALPIRAGPSCFQDSKVPPSITLPTGLLWAPHGDCVVTYCFLPGLFLLFLPAIAAAPTAPTSQGLKSQPHGLPLSRAPSEQKWPG